jgi:uncharacterized protein (DUF885 family)
MTIRKHYAIALSLFSLLYLSCNNNHDSKHNEHSTLLAVQQDSINSAFKNLCDNYINDTWQYNPEAATYVGFHNYDSILTIPNSQYQLQKVQFLQEQLQLLKTFPKDVLLPSHLTDYAIIENDIAYQLWRHNSLKATEWDPSQYNVTGLFAFMLSEQYASLNERLLACKLRLKSVPEYYDAAKQNIKNPVIELKQLAIDQNEGGLYVFEKDIIDSVNISTLSEADKKEIIALSKNAANAVKVFVSDLKKISNIDARSFRLGSDLYEHKFKYEIQANLTAKETYEAALDRKAYLHKEMKLLSDSLWSKYYGTHSKPKDSLALIAKIIDTLSSKHVKPQEFQQAISAQIPQLVQFVKDKNLLYIDSTKPLVIREEPAYMAGVAGASISAPGPYDKNGNTYYNVGSLEGWSAAKAESYLREYNHYILQILNIHEAIPGHYTQLVYANRSPSLVKSILGNGAMIEGWAVYTEQMMLENGYGNNEPEMWLMWYKWHLRTVCNTILDYSVHALQMDKTAALKLLTQEAFQQQAEAEGKWKRVSVSSVQLTSYYSGYKAIYDLRTQLQEREGKKFNLRVFNEKFLSYGSAPVKYISELMLNP